MCVIYLLSLYQVTSPLSSTLDYENNFLKCHLSLTSIAHMPGPSHIPLPLMHTFQHQSRTLARHSRLTLNSARSPFLILLFCSLPHSLMQKGKLYNTPHHKNPMPSPKAFFSSWLWLISYNWNYNFINPYSNTTHMLAFFPSRYLHSHFGTLIFCLCIKHKI